MSGIADAQNSQHGARVIAPPTALSEKPLDQPQNTIRHIENEIQLTALHL
jgi:hypothetical protein